MSDKDSFINCSIDELMLLLYGTDFELDGKTKLCPQNEISIS